MQILLDGDGLPVRQLASTYSVQASEWNLRAQQLKHNVNELKSGAGSWKGSAANAYETQCDSLYSRIQKMVDVYQRMSSTLYLLAERLDYLRGLRNRLHEIRQRLMQLAFTHITEAFQHDSEYGYLQREFQRLEAEIQECEPMYSREARDAFDQIFDSIPTVGELINHFKQVTLSSFFGKGLLPHLTSLQGVAGKTGSDKIDALNETIMENQLVIDYYKEHPEALGPNGESAAQMIAQAKALQTDARKQGGTFGVPIIFMHGLFGDAGTFQKMTDYFGGYTKQYHWTEKRTLDTKEIEGGNLDGDNPIIQFVFDNNTMSFQDQTDGFHAMMTQVKEEYGSDQVMVVAHSMGGVVTTKYIEDYGGDDITKVVTLGSPIKGSQVDEKAQELLVYYSPFSLPLLAADVEKPAINDLRAGSKANEELYDHRGQFNHDIDVFSGAGDKLPGLDDGVVTVDSATALKDFAGKDHFTSKVYHDALHTDLRSNMEEIDDSINFLLYGVKPSDSKTK